MDYFISIYFCHIRSNKYSDSCEECSNGRVSCAVVRWSCCYASKGVYFVWNDNFRFLSCVRELYKPIGSSCHSLLLFLSLAWSDKGYLSHPLLDGSSHIATSKNLVNDCLVWERAYMAEGSSCQGLSLSFSSLNWQGILNPPPPPSRSGLQSHDYLLGNRSYFLLSRSLKILSSYKGFS